MYVQYVLLGYVQVLLIFVVKEINVLMHQFMSIWLENYYFVNEYKSH